MDLLEIPERDDAADMICFFSVFTHLLHEHSFTYLREAARVVRPGGRLVFSFLEYALHWPIFEQTVADVDGALPLNVFLGRDAIAAWAHHLELDVISIEGNTTLPLHEPIVLSDGTRASELALGQSLAVLERPS